MDIICPHCQQVLDVPDELLGETSLECPSCSGAFTPPPRQKPSQSHAARTTSSRPTPTQRLLEREQRERAAARKRTTITLSVLAVGLAIGIPASLFLLRNSAQQRPLTTVSPASSDSEAQISPVAAKQEPPVTVRESVQKEVKRANPSDALRPLLALAQTFHADGELKHAFMFFAVTTTFADCPQTARQTKDGLVKSLNDKYDGEWGDARRNVPWRGERCPLVDDLPEEDPPIEARLLADRKLTGSGEFEGLDVFDGQAVKPIYRTGLGVNTYLVALDSHALRFCADSNATWSYLKTVYGSPTILEEYSSGNPLVVRYGRTVIVLDERGKVNEVLRWLKPTVR